MIVDPKTRIGRMMLWTPLVKEVAEKTGESRERLIALMWRETWCGFAPGYVPRGDPCGWGDNGNGFGLFQIDKRYHKAFVEAEIGRSIQTKQDGLEYSPYSQAMYACDLLRAAREWFKRSASSVKGDDLERAVYASYNAGEHSVYRAVIARKDPDSVTTGKDYSKYIFALAEILRDPKYGNIWSPNAESNR